MTILLLGQTGEVGFELKRLFATLRETVVPARAELELLDEMVVTAYIARYRLKLILNAAAYTTVDKTQHEPLFAARLNANLSAQLAEYAYASGATLIRYSSAYVYPEPGKEPYGGQTETGALGVYGQTKLDGDEAFATNGCRNLIFRTRWVNSARGHNFMKTIDRRGQRYSKLSVGADQVGALTSVGSIVQLSFMAYIKNIYSGVHRLASRRETGWSEFAQAVRRAQLKHNARRASRAWAHPEKRGEVFKYSLHPVCPGASHYKVTGRL